MQTPPIQFELIDIQGYLTIAIYIPFFSPGSLKLHTSVQYLSLEAYEGTFDLPEARVGTRRFQPSESPYPGYCRAPGSSICKPMLCDCEKFTEIWNRIKETKSAQRLSMREAEMKAEKLKLLS